MLVMLGRFCGMCGTSALQHRMPSTAAYQLSLATRAEEGAVPCQSKRKSVRRRVPQQQSERFGSGKRADDPWHTSLVRALEGDVLKHGGSSRGAGGIVTRGIGGGRHCASRTQARGTPRKVGQSLLESPRIQWNDSPSHRHVVTCLDWISRRRPWAPYPSSPGCASVPCRDTRPRAPRATLEARAACCRPADLDA
jgi:hypothetical protein